MLLARRLRIGGGLQRQQRHARCARHVRDPLVGCFERRGLYPLGACAADGEQLPCGRRRPLDAAAALVIDAGSPPRRRSTHSLEFGQRRLAGHRGSSSGRLNRCNSVLTAQQRARNLAAVEASHARTFRGRRAPRAGRGSVCASPRARADLMLRSEILH